MFTSGPSSPPPTSAAVLEFICLYTHDLRRKQKRWQDGRLRYHTFNHRVMVYDERGNFIGDMHWRHDWDLVEGEEIQLERSGVIVQVQELSSRCEQDLSELLDKRAKEKEQRQLQAVARTPAPSALPRTAVRPVENRSIPPDHAQIRHRPLHQVIGTPSGHHGRALVPKESPFEQRQQAAESPDQPAAKRRKYDAPPPSKSGYASALFGQTLTLSATPTSSVPVNKRRQTRHPDPSQEDEDMTAQVIREEAKPPLREQPKVSRHFNQPCERPRPIKQANNTTSSHHDLEDDDEPLRRKQDRISLPKQQIKQRKEPPPTNDEMVDIDSEDTITAKKPARTARTQEEPAKQPKVRKKANDESAVSSSRHDSDAARVADIWIDGVPDSETGNVKAPKTQARAEKSKNSKTNMPKSTAKSLAANIDDDPQGAISPPRKANVPVTELRIRSRKKRGLMMMSEVLKKPRDQPYGDPAMPHPASGTTKAKDVEEIGDSSRSLSPRPYSGMHSEEPIPEKWPNFHRTDSIELGEVEATACSPSPELHAESEPDVLGRNSKVPTQNAASIQLEESDDPVRSPTAPCAHTRTMGYEGKTMVQPRISKGLSIEKNSPFLQPSVSATSVEMIANRGAEDLLAYTQPDDSRTAIHMNFDDFPAEPINETVDQINSLSSQGKVYDPYRLPSSSPEEDFELPARAASSLTIRTSPKADRAKDTGSVELPGVRQSADKGKGFSQVKRATKRPLAFLRNVVLDKDDEMDVPSAAPERPGGDVAEALDSEYGINLKASKKQRESTKSTKQEVKMLVQDNTELDIGEIHSKKQMKPKQAERATKRNAKLQKQESDFDSEDQGSVKRQRPNRKSHAQAMETEETTLPSGQKESTGEPSSKAPRDKKTLKTSMERPRLKTIKKSAKSRELIGFNISALNTPLGLAKIGVPFSILSSPANESIQRRIEIHATSRPFSDSISSTINGQMQFPHSDVLQTAVEANGMAFDARLPEAGCSARSDELLPQPSEPPVLFGGDNTLRIGDFRVESSPALPLVTTQTEEHTAVRDRLSKQTEQDVIRTHQLSSPDTPQSNQVSVVLVSAEHKPGHAAKVVEESTTFDYPQHSECRDSPMIDLSANLGRVEAASPRLQRQMSTASRSINLTHEPSQDLAGLAAGEEVPPVTKCAVVEVLNPPLKTSTAVAQHRKKINLPTVATEGITKINETEEMMGARSVASPSLSAFKLPGQKPTATLQVQSSHTGNSNAESELPKDVEDHAIQSRLATITALPAFKRPEPKTTPALPLQSPCTNDVSTGVDLQHSSDEETARETAAEELPDPLKEIAEKSLSPAPRKQIPDFKPLSKTKVDYDQTDTGSCFQADHPDANDADNLGDEVLSTKPARVLSRSNSGFVQAAEPKVAAHGSDAIKSTPAVSERALSAQRQKRVCLQQAIPVTKRINNLAIEPPQPAIIENPTPAESRTKPASHARIANPASRGRKAAVKSDAKGPVPQRMLPPSQPFFMVPISTAEFSSTPIEEPPKEPERPKKKMTFPGFQSARSEGPWSREAFDLLETGRPG